MIRKSFWVAALFASLCLASVGSATTIFDLNPFGGVLFGQPGELLGWGFTLVNDVPNTYVVVTDTTFVQDTGPGIGTYTDIIASNFFFPVGPATTTTWSQVFDPNLPTGTGSFAVNPAVPFSTDITGHIIVTYDLYSDPNATNLISSGNQFAPLPVEIDISPEPATWALTGGLLILLATRRRRR